MIAERRKFSEKSTGNSRTLIEVGLLDQRVDDFIVKLDDVEET